MLNIGIEKFKTLHKSKKNQIIYYSLKTSDEREINNLIDNFLVEKNSFIFESVEKGKIKGRYTIFGRNPDQIWEFNKNNCYSIKLGVGVPLPPAVRKLPKMVYII